MIVTPNFHFRGNCKEAIEFYKEVFDIQVKCIYENSEADPKDYITNHEIENLIYHAEVILGNTRLIMSDNTNKEEIINDNSLSLMITFDSAKEVKATYNLLKDKAEIISPLQSTTYSSCFVSLKDKFGMRWELMTEQTER